MIDEVVVVVQVDDVTEEEEEEDDDLEEDDEEASPQQKPNLDVRALFLSLTFLFQNSPIRLSESLNSSFEHPV